MTMIYEAESLRKRLVGGNYISDLRLCLTADGRLCDETDPAAVSLLVAAGGTIPGPQARELGLAAGTVSHAEESATAHREAVSGVNPSVGAPEAVPDESEDDEEPEEDESDAEEDEEDEESEEEPANKALQTHRASRRQRR